MKLLITHEAGWDTVEDFRFSITIPMILSGGSDAV
jgi:hypothetical protein